jgi:hypothetical protein
MEHWSPQALSRDDCALPGLLSDITSIDAVASLYFILPRSCWVTLLGNCLRKCSIHVSVSWSSGQSSWLQIQRSGFDSRNYQIFSEVVGLERGPFSLVSTIEELLGRQSSGSGLENREYGRRDPPRWLRVTPLSATVYCLEPQINSRLSPDFARPELDEYITDR